MKLIGPVPHGGKWGFLSESGDWAIEPKFEILGEFREGLAGFGEQQRLGFIDQHAEVVIKPQFKLEYPFPIWGFREGLAPVQPDCTTYINRDGEVVLALPPSGRGWHFVNGRALSMDFQGGYSVIDIQGKTLSTLPIFEAPFLPDWPKDWRCFNCWFRTDRFRAGAINGQGEILFEPKYEALGNFVEGVAGFSTGDETGGWGLVRLTGEVVLEPSLFSIGEFSEGLAPAAKTKREFGFINPNGEWVIEPMYSQAQPFSEGLACVALKRRGFRGFIDAKGEMVVEPRFDRDAGFRDGFAQVEYEGKHAVIDKSGRVIWETNIASE